MANVGKPDPSQSPLDQQAAREQPPSGKDPQGRKVIPKDLDPTVAKLFDETVAQEEDIELTSQEKAYKELDKFYHKLLSDHAHAKNEDDAEFFDQSYEAVEQSLIFLDSLYGLSSEEKLEKAAECNTALEDLITLTLHEAAMLFIEALPDVFQELKNLPKAKSKNPTIQLPSAGSGILKKEKGEPSAKRARKEPKNVTFDESEKQGIVDHEIRASEWQRTCDRGIKKLKNYPEAADCITFLNSNRTQLAFNPGNRFLDKEMKHLMKSLPEETQGIFFRSLPDEIRKRVFPHLLDKFSF